MPLINRLKILEDLYNTYYPRLVESQLLLEALEKLPPDMKLEPEIKSIGPGIPPVRIERTVGDRVKELKEDILVLAERVKAIKTAIKNEKETD